MSLTKKDLAINLSINIGLSQKDSLLVVQNFFRALIKNKKSNISIKNFGTFIYKETPKRIGRNPKSLQEFIIKSRKRLTFKPSDEIKKDLN